MMNTNREIDWQNVAKTVRAEFTTDPLWLRRKNSIEGVNCQPVHDVTFTPRFMNAIINSKYSDDPLIADTLRNVTATALRVNKTAEMLVLLSPTVPVLATMSYALLSDMFNNINHSYVLLFTLLSSIISFSAFFYMLSGEPQDRIAIAAEEKVLLESLDEKAGVRPSNATRILIKLSQRSTISTKALDALYHE